MTIPDICLVDLDPAAVPDLSHYLATTYDMSDLCATRCPQSTAIPAVYLKRDR